MGGLLQALRRLFSGRQDGLPPLRAAFSRDFIWPLRPAQVARWAQRHGQAQPLAPADWPQRCVDTDRARLARLRQQGRAHDVPLHVLTAAIGVGDRRIRVLLGADGSVLGPRAYSRGRVGGAAAVLCLGLMGAGWGLRPLQALPAADQPAAQAALAGPAASSTVAPVTASASASAASNAHTDTHASTPASTPASAPAIGPPPLAHAASATAPDNSASAPAADIRPALSETQKETARAQSALLRGETPAATAPQPGDGPVYAVISRASRQHDTAAGNLALMRAAAERLGSDAPGHRELLESQGEWRAAWWPFTTMVDAERARVMLIGKGLKAEVVSF